MRVRCRWGRCADGGFACSNVSSGERIVSRGFQSGTVERRRIRPASDGQSRGEGEWRGTDGPRLAARDVRALPLREAAWRLPEEAGARDPARRVADDHLRRAGVSGGGAAEDDDCAGAHHSRRTQFQGPISQPGGIQCVPEDGIGRVGSEAAADDQALAADRGHAEAGSRCQVGGHAGGGAQLLRKEPEGV